MTQEELWQAKYEEVRSFIEKNRRNPSRYDAEERGRYVNWVRHNRKLMNAGEMKPERVGKFEELMTLMEKYRHKNQYE